MTTLYMPDGTSVKQGSAEDRATWWRCGRCGHVGPHVGTDTLGHRLCLGVFCGGTIKNPTVPRLTQPTVPEPGETATRRGGDPR